MYYKLQVPNSEFTHSIKPIFFPPEPPLPVALG